MPRTKKQRFWREYRAAVSEHHRLTNYLNATHGILTQPERKLLLDFVDDAKRESARLRRVLALRRLDQIPKLGPSDLVSRPD